MCLGDVVRTAKYQRYYENMKLAVKTLHWNETDGIWYDYDLEHKVSVVPDLPKVCLEAF